ncbi:hypothetical protein E5676_scaffold96G00980 [Cucumis melo var. makuwa]|uniref:Uncharacterized protein n=1 Tax=Cucumis melo var. makuwa TaxID=1194695 RepID=A0A5D3D0R2_CUCMM|nr:hypothetical protein E6C27_scaffold134G001000 [Cucumis melo var. makuwa]TYK16824.1 hypothetical protein E5676_scaffold96G00980 [Cucumis melo var. makuwa]
MSSEKGSARGRTNFTSSKGNRQYSSSNSAPSPMSANQYTMDLGFTTVTRSRSRSYGIRIGSPTESSTPPRPSVNLIRPSGGVVQMRPSPLLHPIGILLFLLQLILRLSPPINGLCQDPRSNLIFKSLSLFMILS